MSEADEQTPREIACEVTPGLQQWLFASGGSIAVTTYQAGKIALFGKLGDQVSLLMRDFRKPMGFHVMGNRMALATKHEITILANAPLLAPDYLEKEKGRYDGLFLPRVTYYTGDCNVHDVAFGKEGVWFVNTRFSCLSGLSHDFCCIPRWKPPFVSELAPEDRCHLNGLAMVNGEPKYVTALGTTDFPGAWREQKATGGVVMEVPSGEIVVRGLAMPHSPRWHNGALWFLNSGEGQLCRMQPGRPGFDVVCQIPGYLRGLCLMGSFALVGMCQVREKHIFGGLPIQNSGVELKCGVALIDLTRGVELGRINFTAGCTEIFEVQFLPGLKNVMIVNSQQEAAQQAFPCPEFSYWLRPSNLVADFN
ncbi:TIGR03032 family protein [Planctomicrobium piriforme]|uniref:TIGR03032 family protein n=1 Tax=Planctomicrobium piriforme TaxID=1576369 RepID=A0A1I3G4H6_9PLAN|nr:TIGR03032 family protein [Planctomicrobium piriforme]SFI18383.1 TIGR03032 family protein [Planctomicrobium piriforme]